MHPLTSTFEAGKTLLANNPAVPALANPETPIAAKMAVVPTMSFWVLAFGDAMSWVRQTVGETELDHILATHAEEDAEHWRWFIADLESLAAQGLGLHSVGEALLRQWGPETAPVRECAWVVHHLLRTHTDPVIRLGIVEACEHGFEAFMDSMRPVIREAGQYTTLRYFGEIHDHAEADHAMHELADPFDGVDWADRDVDAVRDIVRTVYAHLDAMHRTYAVAIAAASRGDG